VCSVLCSVLCGSAGVLVRMRQGARKLRRCAESHIGCQNYWLKWHALWYRMNELIGGSRKESENATKTN
jgi:hypothetical protein